MNLEILDCTLRDGGYTNNWMFNQEFILNSINSLIKSGVKNIECGYLNQSSDLLQNKEKKINSTKLQSIKEFNYLLSNINKESSLFFLMIDFNSYDTNNLINKENSIIDGIRLAFHKKDLDFIYNQAEIIKKKNYKLFIQPMAIHLYSESEIDQLIKISEELKADSFYIVDSFGSLDYQELKNYFFKIHNHLSKKISIGLHLHNNIDTAFSNSINLFFDNYNIQRDIIVDTSISGMGRGAGNIKTEFLLLYLQKKLNVYKPEQILNLIDNTNFLNSKANREDISFFISGINKNHPSKVIKLLENECKLEEIYNTFII